MTTTITLLDGRRIASNHSGDAGLTRHNSWRWVLDHLTAEFDCRRDEISIIEANEDEPHDLIALRGHPVAVLEERP